MIKLKTELTLLPGGGLVWTNACDENISHDVKVAHALVKALDDEWLGRYVPDDAVSLIKDRAAEILRDEFGVSDG